MYLYVSDYREDVSDSDDVCINVPDEPKRDPGGLGLVVLIFVINGVVGGKGRGSGAAAFPPTDVLTSAT